MKRCFLNLFLILLAIVIGAGDVGAQNAGDLPRVSDNAFPVAVQFSPVPSGEGWKGGDQPLTMKLEKQTVDNIIDHGFSILSIGNWTKKDQTPQDSFLLHYAQSKGMKINYITGGLEIFKRDRPPFISVYSKDYQREVKRRVDSALRPIQNIKRIYSLFPYQDEPFHAGPESFDYSKDAKIEFQKRMGYPMPVNLSSVRNDPKKWLDLLNFQSTTFSDGWKPAYKIIKKYNPKVKVVLTHDSHSAFGGGVNSDSKVAMDDVFHWGGDFADIFIYDIYPYTMFDYRYGEPGKIPKPRISQMHYTISQLRNLTTTYHKELAFWVGTYNAAWFRRFMGPERQHTYWAERELAYTAIAQGANFLITGIKIPSDSLHWDDFGKSLNVVQKAGVGLLKAPKVKANACFLFPRTQYLQLQEEYFNEGLTFELFLRAFGELDMLHEEQVNDDNLNGYKVLILGDVKLLPENVAKKIISFVKKGGIVIADCVPQMNENKDPMDDMMQLFGVTHSQTDRIPRNGQWVPFTTLPPKMGHAPEVQQTIQVRKDRVIGSAFGEDFDFPVVSPRVSEVKDGRVLLRMKTGAPAVITKQVGKGKVYLIGFCLQDSYFETWKNSDDSTRCQLRTLLKSIFNNSGISSHVYSSNPDIEASVRADMKEGYIFIINHESPNPQTEVLVKDLHFRIGKIVDLENNTPVKFASVKDGVQIQINAPIGTTRLLKISP